MRIQALSALLLTAGPAWAQFGAHSPPPGQPQVFCLMELPWILLLVAMALALFFSRAKRSALLQAIRRSTLSYMGLSSSLLALALCFHATDSADWLFLAFMLSLLYSGLLLSTLLTIHLLWICVVRKSSRR